MARLTGLPEISHAEAHLRQVLPAALTGRRCGDVTLVARIPAAAPPATGWFACAGGLAFAIERLDGESCRASAADGIAAAVLIERAEPLLREIEIALGIELEPLDIVDGTPGDALVVSVSAQRRGIAVDRLHLAVPPELDVLPAAAEFAPELLGRVHVPVTIRLPGPRLAPHDAAGLSAGDVLLLGAAPLPGRLVAGGHELAGLLDPARRAFTPCQED